MGNAKHTAVAVIAVAMISSLAVKQMSEIKNNNRLAALLSNSSGNENVVSQTITIEPVAPADAEEYLNEVYTQEEIQEIIDEKSEKKSNYVMLSEGVLNVYDSPSLECAPVDALSATEEVKVLEATDEWYKVSYADGKSGYVSKTKITESKAEADHAAMHYDNYETAKIKTNGGAANIRSKASKGSSVIGQLENNADIVIQFEEGEYTKVCYGSDYDTGYIVTSVIETNDGWVSKTDVAETQRKAAERRAAEKAAAEKAAKEKAAREAAAREAKKNASKSSGTKVTSKEGGTSYTTPAASSKGQAIVNEAKKYLGVRYVYGGTSPKGFDCSGLVQYVCRAVGVSVNRTAAAQFSNGRAVNKSDLQPGDLLFFAKNGRIHHVGIYVGNGQMIHAPQTGDVVKYSSINTAYRQKGYAGARRVY